MFKILERQESQKNVPQKFSQKSRKALKWRTQDTFKKQQTRINNTGGRINQCFYHCCCYNNKKLLLYWGAATAGTACPFSVTEYLLPPTGAHSSTDFSAFVRAINTPCLLQSSVIALTKWTISKTLKDVLKSNKNKIYRIPHSALHVKYHYRNIIKKVQSEIM